MAKKSKAKQLVDDCKNFISEQITYGNSEAEINSAFFEAFRDFHISAGIDVCVEANNYPEATKRKAKSAAAGGK